MVGFIGVLLLSVVVYCFSVYKGLNDIAKEMHEPIDRELSDKRDAPFTFEKKEPFSTEFVLKEVTTKSAIGL